MSQTLFARIVRFGAFGGTASGTHAGLAALLVEICGSAPLAANAVGFCAGLGISYVLNSRSTWKDRARGGKGQAIRFSLVTLAGLGINLIAVATAQAAGLPWWLGMLAGIVVGAGFNFAAHEYWTFRPSLETAGA